MTTESIIGIVIMSLLFGSVVVEHILDVSWNRKYFTSGLPIFVRRVPVRYWHTNIPSHALLEANFHSDVIRSLVFKPINSCSYAFREAVFQFQWIRTPNVMHGLLVFDRNQGEVLLIGFMNLSALTFCVAGLGAQVVGIFHIIMNQESVSSLWGPLVASTIFVLFGILMYEFQAARFSIVADFAAESWARKYVREDSDEA